MGGNHVALDRQRGERLPAKVAERDAVGKRGGHQRCGQPPGLERDRQRRGGWGGGGRGWRGSRLCWPRSWRSRDRTWTRFHTRRLEGDRGNGLAPAPPPGGDKGKGRCQCPKHGGEQPGWQRGLRCGRGFDLRQRRGKRRSRFSRDRTSGFGRCGRHAVRSALDRGGGWPGSAAAPDRGGLPQRGRCCGRLFGDDRIGRWRGRGRRRRGSGGGRRADNRLAGHRIIRIDRPLRAGSALARTRFGQAVVVDRLGRKRRSGQRERQSAPCPLLPAPQPVHCPVRCCVTPTAQPRASE